GRKRGCRPRLVVVLQKAGEFVLIIQPCVKVFAHRTGVVLTKAVVEPLVVRVVETLLLERPFQVPVNLRHEDETGHSFAHALSRLWPEERRALTPGSLEDLGQG